MVEEGALLKGGTHSRFGYPCTSCKRDLGSFNARVPTETGKPGKMVMEKSWYMKNQSGNFTNFAQNFNQFIYFIVSTKKSSSNLESPHFPTKCRECKIGKRDAHGK